MVGLRIPTLKQNNLQKINLRLNMRCNTQNDDEEAEVMMSPLIDCVFLLLIFFLATTMIKKWEKQIPVTLPDNTSSLSAEANDDTFVIGVDSAGNPYDGNQRNPRNGRLVYTPIPDLAIYLQELASERDTTLPLEIAADRNTPMQVVIDALDICQLQGFTKTNVRLKDR
jgi:biopolymer transport protein ExbD